MLRMYLIRPDGVYRTSVLQPGIHMNPVKNAMQVADQFTRLFPMTVPPAQHNADGKVAPWFVSAYTPPSDFRQRVRQAAAASTPNVQPAAAPATTNAGPSATVTPPAADQKPLGDYTGIWAWIQSRARNVYAAVKQQDRLRYGQNVFPTSPQPNTSVPGGAATTASGLAPAMNPQQTLPGQYPTRTDMGMKIAQRSAGGLPPGVVLPSPAAAMAIDPNVAMRPETLARQLVQGPEPVQQGNIRAMQEFYRTYRNY